MSLFDDPPATPARHALGDVVLGTGGTVRSVTGRCGARAERVTVMPTLVTCPDCVALERPATAPTVTVEPRSLCFACSAPPEPGSRWCGPHGAVAARGGAAAADG